MPQTDDRRPAGSMIDREGVTAADTRLREGAEAVGPDQGRRGFLRRLGGLALAGAAGVVAPGLFTAEAEAAIAGSHKRSLSFRSLHTGETLSATYFSDGRYDPRALADMAELLRDWRTGEVGQIDPALYDLLFALRRRLRSDKPFNVISGYRCPRTNAMLASQSGGVAKQSLHMQGKAIDIALPGRTLREVRQAALDLRQGGVGLYTRSGFVHVDTGRVRQWGA
ncbi:MAG: hypothetical protein RLY86_1954 [Pseudomonadota bacterium]|jgi:uncharacterized protein YcbK (DUF882 family)